MADVHDPATRSYNMSKIKGNDTKPELLVRGFLHKNGVRFRLHNKNLPGKPDLTLRRYKTVIFVNGCFWHGHYGCKYFVMPKTRSLWWKKKIGATIQRDQRSIEALSKMGWKIIIIWECSLKTGKSDKTLSDLFKRLSKHKNGNDRKEG